MPGGSIKVTSPVGGDAGSCSHGIGGCIFPGAQKVTEECLYNW